MAGFFKARATTSHIIKRLLHLENVALETIQAIFLVTAGKIVRGRLVSVVMHYRSQVVHGTRRSFGCRLVLFLLIHFFTTL